MKTLYFTASLNKFGEFSLHSTQIKNRLYLSYIANILERSNNYKVNNDFMIINDFKRIDNKSCSFTVKYRRDLRTAIKFTMIDIHTDIDLLKQDYRRLQHKLRNINLAKSDYCFDCFSEADNQLFESFFSSQSIEYTEDHYITDFQKAHYLNGDEYDFISELLG